jgi:hypothetical protein
MNTRKTILVMVLADLVLPIGAYYLLRALGVGDLIALTCAAVLSALRVVIAAVQARRLDAVAAVVLCFFALSLVAMLLSQDAKVALAMSSLPTLVLGLWFLGSLLVGRALAFFLFLPLLTGGSKDQEAFWRRAWSDGPTFRHALRVLTLGWGCLLVAEAAVRCVLVVLLPIDALVAVSSVLQVLLVLCLLGFTGWYAKTSGLGIRRYLDTINDGTNEDEQAQPA